MLHDKVNLAEKLAQFSDHWAPRTAIHLVDLNSILSGVSLGILLFDLHTWHDGNR